MSAGVIHWNMICLDFAPSHPYNYRKGIHAQSLIKKQSLPFPPSGLLPLFFNATGREAARLVFEGNDDYRTPETLGGALTSINLRTTPVSAERASFAQQTIGLAKGSSSMHF